MTLKEVFLYFCKENKILGIIMILYNTYLGRANNRKLTFQEVFDSKMRYSSTSCLLSNFSWIGNEYLDELFGAEGMTRFSKALRKWDYFCKHNIDCVHTLQVGDSVSFKYDVALNVFKLYHGVVTNIDTISDGRVLITTSDFRKLVYVHDIVICNNTPCKVEYYIKKRGKRIN